MSNCRSCGAEIVWAITPAGRRMPLDPDPVEAGLKLKPGMFTLREDEIAQGGITSVVNRATPVAAGLIPAEGPYYQSHFSSCPNADRHRRSR